MEDQNQTQKEKKSVGTILLIILLLIVTIASLILATYAWAKYSSAKEGTATADVAKWNVDVSFDHSNYQEQTFSHVLPQRLAPGTSGQFEIKIDPKDTEVDFHYEVILEKVEGVEGGTVPKHLHFYTSDEHDEDDLIGEITGTGDEEKDDGTNVTNKLSGDIKVVNESTGKEQKADAKTVIIYWDWPYEDPSSPEATPDTYSIATPAGATPTLTASPNGISDYDDQDTLDGMNASQVKVTYKVITTQLQPSPTSYAGA